MLTYKTPEASINFLLNINYMTKCGEYCCEMDNS